MKEQTLSDKAIKVIKHDGTTYDTYYGGDVKEFIKKLKEEIDELPSCKVPGIDDKGKEIETITRDYLNIRLRELVGEKLC
jgi:hypothetical protein